MKTGMKIVSCCEHASLKNIPDITFYSRDLQHRYGLTKRQGYISWNGSSGAAAINLAYLMGAKTVVLLGFDMRRVEGEKNWHSDHKESPVASPFSRHLKAFSIIKQDAEKVGLRIVNATPESAIREFPIVSLEEML